MVVVVVVVEVVAVVVARVAEVAVAEATAARHRSRITTSAKDVATTTIYLHCRCNRRLLPLAIGFATSPVLDAWDGIITPGRDARGLSLSWTALFGQILL